MTSQPVPARPAATLIMLREGGTSSFSALMQVRHEKLAFASGALVFPGGRVDPDDAVTAGRLPHAAADGLAAFKVAAIRETFEECGVLLAYAAGTAEMVGADRALDIAARYRQAVSSGERRFSDLLQDEALLPAIGQLVHFAHWITPETRPKRFDTHFFITDAAPGQEPTHDDGETTDSVWISPADAIEGAAAGRYKLVFATRLNLQKLTVSETAADALAAARSATVVTVRPRTVETPDGPMIRIEAAAGYGGDTFPPLDAPAM